MRLEADAVTEEFGQQFHKVRSAFLVEVAKQLRSVHPFMLLQEAFLSADASEDLETLVGSVSGNSFSFWNGRRHMARMFLSVGVSWIYLSLSLHMCV